MNSASLTAGGLRSMFNPICNCQILDELLIIKRSVVSRILYFFLSLLTVVNGYQWRREQPYDHATYSICSIMLLWIKVLILWSSELFEQNTTPPPLQKEESLPKKDED